MITVKDIREKEFLKAKHGYDEDEVDEFLDEIAEQLEMLIRENLSLSEQLEAAKKAPAPAPAVVEAPVVAQPRPVEARAQEPLADEPSYFRNLETTLRETLISAQRIADETVADARKKSKQMIASAEEQSGQILSTAKSDAEAAKAEGEELRKAAGDYRARFLRMVQEQMHAIKADESLFE